MQPCEVAGFIPNELIGGQYIRNGGNPLPNSDPTRTMHWFDGHGMLSGVYFLPLKGPNGPEIEVLYSNQYVLTDVFLAESKHRKLQAPIVPSIAPMLNPKPSLLSMCKIIMDILRTVCFVFYSSMSYSLQSIKRISVANTNIVFHNSRFLATCESGPPIRVHLPDMKTVGWFDGQQAEGEYGIGGKAALHSDLGKGLFGFFYEWTTGHVSVDQSSCKNSRIKLI
jgi:carotenoid cleavage dioxygenase-like enzyme